MKKIYILTAVLSLLTLSLNAQLLPEFQKLKTNPTQFTELRNGQHNNVSSSTTSNHGKSMRAPLKALSDGEYYVGPYTTDDFSNNGLGFANFYNSAQSIVLGVTLTRDEFEQYIGEEIVGFRFALAGTGVVPVFDFNVIPYHETETSLTFDQDNMQEWTLGAMNGDGYVKVTSINDITDDGEYLIVCENNSVAFNGGLTNLNVGNNIINVSINNNRIETSTDANAAVFYIEKYNNTQYLILSASGYYIGYTGTGTDMSTTNNLTNYNRNTYLNTITFDNNGNAVISGNRTSNARQLRFNSASGTNNYRFRYYQAGSQQNVQIYKRIGTDVVFLNGGQWHEYRLAEPITFNAASGMESLFIGYNFYQPLANNTTYEVYPVAVNPNSTTHDHMALMYASTGSSYQRSWWLLGNINGDLAVQLIFKSEKTKKPVITYQVNGDNVVITATGDGTVTLTVDGQTVQGQGTASITVPRTDTTYNVTATATAQETGKQESNPETQVITIPFLQTEAPVITYTSDGESVTITATGDGTVTLTVGGQTVQGQGSASITIPCGMTSTTVTATATAQETGKAVSDPTTEQIPIPAIGGWLLMDGTYNNPNDLLSFEYQGKEIMLIDQFLESTLLNDHPDGYIYTLRETINNEEKSSNAVNIPVYKTNSSIQGLYTKAQVDEDIDMHLTANAINSEMDYYVHPDRNTLYHSLYRGDKNAAYPVIDVPHRISQLQKFDELVGDQVQYFFFENHQENITPMYDHLGTGIAERVDTKYVIGQAGDELSYVPVIWTFGLYTARGDGKNNSYGADIKRETLGDVTVQISGSRSGGDNLEEATHNGWEGLFKVGDEYYCIYTPIITINGITPAEKVQNDGDVSTYTPYMYRAWCLYEGARDFKHVMQDNGNGTMVGVLTDNGPLTIPYLLGTEVTENTIGHIGTAWTGGPRLQWAFGVPFDEDPANVPIAVRFYYKKTVNEVAANNLRAGNRDGEEDENSEEYYIVQVEGSAKDIETAINEFYYGKAIVGITYVNAQGMTSDKPFNGLNIVVTRYSDGTTSTVKVFK